MRSNRVLIETSRTTVLLQTTRTTSRNCISSWIKRILYWNPSLVAYRRVYTSLHQSKQIADSKDAQAEASSRYPTMTRFFAHLCLFFQMIDIPVSPFATQVILEAYLQVLEVRLMPLNFSHVSPDLSS